jgi:hypothetical protein
MRLQRRLASFSLNFTSLDLSPTKEQPVLVSDGLIGSNRLGNAPNRPGVWLSRRKTLQV